MNMGGYNLMPNNIDFMTTSNMIPNNYTSLTSIPKFKRPTIVIPVMNQ